MKFGEKLYRLRKKHDFSQEVLAEKLNTSRQAISKWENDQGFPETEKLIMLGNIFNVSIDYLLTESTDEVTENEDGYYVSKELAEAYLLSTHKTASHVAIGIGLFVLAGIPYFIFGTNSILSMLLIIGLVALGIISFATLGFEGDQYKQLKNEKLVFDPNYAKELTMRYDGLKRKHNGVNVLGACLLVIGILPFALERKWHMEALVPYYPIFICLIAIGLPLFIRIAIILSGYKLLVYNDEHTDRFGFKLKQKAKKKFDEF